jgi:poly(3-hydroxybutyrate) depolymerase
MKEATKLVDSRLNTDPNARYLLGFSEGAEFAPHVVGNMPGYWAGVGAWHPTREGAEAAPDGDPVAYVQITGEKDKVLPRYGGTADDTFMGGIFGTLYPRLASSEPTAAFDRMAQSQGATGNPTIDKSDPARIVTTFKSDQTATHRPVVEVDEINGEHAVDDNSGGFMTRAIGWVTGSKDRSFDSPQYMVDTLLKYRKNAPPPSETEGVFVP